MVWVAAADADDEADADEDGEEEEEEPTPAKKRQKTATGSALSPEMQEFLGVERMTRAQVHYKPSLLLISQAVSSGKG